MLKYKSVIIIIITSIIILLGMSVKSIAVDNTCKLSLDIDKKQVKRGDTVTVLIKASDIQGDGIAIFNANLSYDKDTFECTVNGNEEANWVLQGNIENNNQTFANKYEIESNISEELYEKLKVKKIQVRKY